MFIFKLYLKFSSWFNKISSIKFITIFLVMLFLKNGVWPIPNISHFFIMSQNIKVNPFSSEPQAHYVMTSFLGPLIANLLNLNKSLIVFLTMHFIVMLLGLFFLIYYSTRRSQIYSKLVLSLFLSLPISTTLMLWVGYDAFTFLFSTLIVLNQNLLFAFIFGFLVGINHFEQMIITFSLMLIPYFIIRSDNNKKIKYLISVGGIVFGRIALEMWFYCNNIHLESSRTKFIIENGIGAFFRADLRSLFPLLFSIFSTGWIVIVEIYQAFKINKMYNAAMCIQFVVVLIVSLISMDETRVFALISWPIILDWIDKYYYYIKNKNIHVIGQISAIVFISGMLFPAIIIWGGKIQSTTLYYSFGLVVDLLFNTKYVIGNPNWMILPFQ